MKPRRKRNRRPGDRFLVSAIHRRIALEFVPARLFQIIDAGEANALKDSAALNLKRRIAADLVVFFGEDAIRHLLDGIKPRWDSDLRVPRERHGQPTAGGHDTTGR